MSVVCWELFVKISAIPYMIRNKKNQLSPIYPPKLQRRGKTYHPKPISGFTLIELLISMALIAILTGSAIQIARFSDTHKNLTLAANEMSAVIRSAQSSSLSIPNPQDRHVCGFGVWFGDKDVAATDTQYEMFYTYVVDGVFTTNPKTCDENAGYRDGTTNYELIEAHALPNGVTLDGGVVDETIFFKVPYGEAFANDGSALTSNYTITIDSGSNSRDVVVTPSGQVE
jgi:prepilin-type N-terminal cleavage/methylation domain-containing protein